MIVFKKVRWKNFLSTGNQFTEIQLDRNPTTLIIGENGAGKSTILDALCFGLFGKPFRNINKAQLINTINLKDLIVEVEFKISSVEYLVTRGMKPNRFEIYQNGILMNQDANNRDYQKILEQQILKLNYRSFTQVVILGSSTFVPFMQLKARHRREVVEEILDIQIFSLMNLLLKQKLKDLVDEIRDMDYQVNMAMEKISMQENHIDDIKENRSNAIREKQIKYNNNKDLIHEKNTERVGYDEKNKNLFASIDDQIEAEKRSSKFKEIRATLIEKHKTHESMIDFFETNIECPTCQQHIDENYKNTMITNRKEEDSVVTKGLKELREAEGKNQERLNEIKKITDEIRDNQVTIARLNSSVTELEKFNAVLLKEIKTQSNETISQDDIDKLKDMKKECKVAEEKRAELKKEKTYTEASKVMLQDTGIKTKIIKQYLPVMNKLINKYLNSMEFYVNFTLDENFNETIKSRYRDDFSYASFSEGEKMRIDLALLFTWRAIAKMKNSTNTNLLILDEIFDSSLDGAGTDEFLKILNTLTKENVFVISHKQDMLIDKFRSVLQFKKEKGFSHVA
jgi:DNA repair exonuclease SbcCD ATPase subunit